MHFSTGHCRFHGPAGVAPNSPLTEVPPLPLGGEDGRPSRYSWLMARYPPRDLRGRGHAGRPE